jgi:hypothetical protein
MAGCAQDSENFEIGQLLFGRYAIQVLKQNNTILQVFTIMYLRGAETGRACAFPAVFGG